MAKAPEDLTELQETLQEEVIVAPPDPEVVVITSESPFWTLAAEIEAEVFIDAGYVQHAAELEEEYRPYINSSFFFAMMDGSEIKGVLRIIDHSDAGFKTLVDTEAGKLIIEDSWKQRLTPEAQKSIFEVGTIAVPPKHRTKDAGRASMWLYGAVLGYSRANNLPNAIASFDADYFEGFQGLFGEGLQAMGPAVEYMGSKTVPVYMNENASYANICSVDATGELKETLDRGAQQITNV